MGFRVSAGDVANEVTCDPKERRPLENDLCHIFDALPEQVWTSSADGRIDFLNARWCEFTGLSAEESRGCGWKAAISPEDLPRLVEYWQAILASGEAGHMEARVRHRDGEYRWFLFRARPLRDASGAIVKWFGTNTDIDQRVRAENALRESELQYRSIVETIPGLIVVITPAGEVEYATRQSLEYFGTTLEGLKRRTTSDGVHPDDLDDALAARRRALETGSTYEVECRILGADGYRWFQARGSPERDDAGRITRWYVLMTDIDARKRSEAAYKQGAAFLAQAQRLSSTGSFSWRVQADELTWSAEAYRIYEVDEGVPLTFEVIATRIHPEDLPAFYEGIARARCEGNDLECEQRLQRADKSIKYLHIVARASRDEAGQLEYIGAVQDITERRLSEYSLSKVRSELAYVARISTLGALTASIAHEVNQPLSGIITNASTCLRMLADDPPNVEGARETARRAIRDGNRAAEVIARLRALFSRREATTEWVDVNAAIQEVIALSEVEIQRERATVRADLARDLPPVMGDRIQLQQVIVNLIRNGIEAMNAVEDRPRQLVIKTECETGERVRVSVQDAGTGFDLANVERLFAAFHTTKCDGMGIGLSVSQSIIRSHEGTLWGTLNDGPGATFGFSIPRVHDRSVGAGFLAPGRASARPSCPSDPSDLTGLPAEGLHPR